MKAILKIENKEIEVEISKEELEKLTEKKSPFERGKKSDNYFSIGADGELYEQRGEGCFSDKHYKIANCCTDKALLQQQAYRETLNRLLWRWQYEHDEPVNWHRPIIKYKISMNLTTGKFEVSGYVGSRTWGAIYFTTREKAEQAIKEIVGPFMAAHPDFKW